MSDAGHEGHEEDGSNHMDEEFDDDNNDNESGPPTKKRQRVRLSCLECRRRKLSCSRELPCDRCIKSGTPERCTYETRDGSLTSVPPGDRLYHGSATHSSSDPRRSLAFPRREADPSAISAAKDHDRIRKLELEVAQLRHALTKHSSVSLDGSTIAASPSTLKDVVKESPPEPPEIPSFMRDKRGDGLEFKFLRGHNFKTRFFSNAWSAFRELDGIFPFMRETSEEWLRPLNIQKKDRKARKEVREAKFSEPELTLEALLPSREDTDALIAVYLDQFEQIHRIVHIPTFKKEYAAFWDDPQSKYAALTALILSMIAVSSSLDDRSSSKFIGIQSSSFQRAERWVKAVDEWLERQSQKHRRLVHFQIMCILHLAKRVNVIKKKRMWTSAGALLRDGITVGLHLDPANVAAPVTPYNCEMRRRVWATILEFDLQASFDQGVPSLLNGLHHDAKPPLNIDDEAFNEDTVELPPSKPATEMTWSSFQSISRQSLPLRLELHGLLAKTRDGLDWEQVTRYTELITHEIDALPAWDLEPKEAADSAKKPLLVHTMLHLQLRQFLVPMHQPYLKLRKYSSKYQVAEFNYYNAARDIVLMHDRLFQNGIRALSFLREDIMYASVNLCNVTLHQSRGSTSLILSNSKETINLIEKCLTIKEDRILRCGNNDPWGYSSMCAALGLLETYLGQKTSDSAKAAAAERFISLHYKLIAYQVPSATQPAEVPTPAGTLEIAGLSKPATPFPTSEGAPSATIGNTPWPRPDGLPLTMPWLLPSMDASQNPAGSMDMNVNLDVLGMDLDELWGGDINGGEFTGL